MRVVPEVSIAHHRTPVEGTTIVPTRRRCRQDVRTGGKWSPRQRAKNTAIAALVAAGARLADRLPVALLLAAGRAAGLLAYWTLQPVRSVAHSNLERLLPPQHVQASLRACFVRAGENLGVSLLLRRPRVRALDWVSVDVTAARLLTRALAHGRGAVFVSAHLGPFELIPAAVAELGHRPAVVVRESYDPRLDRIVDAHRIGRGVEVIHRGRPGAPSRILRALRAGKPVGFLPDLGGRVPSARTSVLGRPALLPIGPQRIALRAGCPLLFGWLRPTTPCRARRPHFQLLLERLPLTGNEATVTHCVADAISRAILAHPSQWLGMAASLPDLQSNLLDG